MTNATAPSYPAPARVAKVKRSLPKRSSRGTAASHEYHRYASNTQCPHCGGRLMRTARRLRDRVWSLLVPLKRFRCDRFSCQWIGNIPRDSATAATSANSLLAPGSPGRTMAFAFASLLALTVYVAFGPSA